MSTILVIEDDARIRANILDLLEAEGYTGIGAENGERGVQVAVQQLPDLIICDVSMPGIDGYEVFELLSAQTSTATIPFVFLSARAERADVRRGMSLGAEDYLTKPFTRTDLLDAIRIRLKRRRWSDPSAANEPATPSETPAPPRSGNHEVVVRDAAMVSLFQQLDRIAPGPISVLILGETGVGKEVVAEELHRRSKRPGRFVAVNCAALTETLLESELFGHEKGAFTGALRAQEGLFEAADGGTVFLDEIGELPPATQVKLLRVLENRMVTRVGGRQARHIDVRFVSATHRDLEREIEDGNFRQDLYFRLNGVTLQVPPLRERIDDIPALVDRFVRVNSSAIGRTPPPSLATDTLECLRRYSWPGNIRELRNVIERAVMLCEGAVITTAHLPQKLTAPQTSGDLSDPRARLLQAMEQVERQRVVDALARSGGNQTQAAALLGISRRTLVTRLGLFDLPRPRKPRHPPHT